MCLLILQEKESKIKDNLLKNAYNVNPDGVGYSYVDNGKLTTKKYRKYNKFLSNWKSDVREFGSVTPFLLHFRLATHGLDEGTFNVHPFTVRQGLVFAHNGIINEVDNDKKLSDTQVFNRDILKNLKKSFLHDEILLKLIEGFIGASKLVFLKNDSTYKIVNESAGHWKDGVWFSNSSYDYKPYTIYKPHTYGGYSDYTSYGWEDDNFDIGRDTKQAKEPTKYIPNKEQCGYCGDYVHKLIHTNISDMYDDGGESYLWMCEACVEQEDEYRKEEEAYNKSFEDSKKVALLPLRGSA
tara:strand:+ start:529 stop:1416 length:888 start_codon:yes stop_codon:yes gene_type:complete